LLEQSAAEAISALSIAASNYKEKIDILKARFVQQAANNFN